MRGQKVNKQGSFKNIDKEVAKLIEIFAYL